MPTCQHSLHLHPHDTHWIVQRPLRVYPAQQASTGGTHSITYTQRQWHAKLTVPCSVKHTWHVNRGLHCESMCSVTSHCGYRCPLLRACCTPQPQHRSAHTTGTEDDTAHMHTCDAPYTRRAIVKQTNYEPNKPLVTVMHAAGDTGTHCHCCTPSNCSTTTNCVKNPKPTV